MSERQVVICNPVRTAIGTYNGTLKSTSATVLGATVVKAAGAIYFAAAIRAAR